MDALGGHTFLRGYRDSDPSYTPGVAHGDPNAGIHVAFAVQAALFARERSGRGQMIDLSHVEAGLHHISWALMDYSFNRRVRGTFGNRHPSKAPSGVFRCLDAPGEQSESSRRRWIAIAVASDEQFAALAAEMGAPELAGDPRFATSEVRYEHQDELEPLIEAWTSRHVARELMDRLQAAGVPATELLRQEELRENEHLRERGFWQEVDHPAGGDAQLPGPGRPLPRAPTAHPQPRPAARPAQPRGAAGPARRQRRALPAAPRRPGHRRRLPRRRDVAETGRVGYDRDSRCLIRS